MEMRFGLVSGREMTQKEVADEMGISSHIFQGWRKNNNKVAKKFES